MWTNALAVAPQNPNTLYAATERCGYVYQSTDAGQIWRDITPDMPGEECWVWAVKDLVVEAGGDLLAATSSGLRRWNGAAWNQVPGAPAAEPAQLALDRATSPETIYLGTKGSGVFVSHDGGASWEGLNAGLGDRDITALAVTAAPHHRLYAGTEDGGVWEWQLGMGEANFWIWLPAISR
jgi:photosystem II stability/assembly factor-like uncharacterized protein